MWGLDAEERRLFGGLRGEDLQAVMRDAGWKTMKAIPLSIDLNKTRNAGGGLGRLLRGAGITARCEGNTEMPLDTPGSP